MLFSPFWKESTKFKGRSFTLLKFIFSKIISLIKEELVDGKMGKLAQIAIESYSDADRFFFLFEFPDVNYMKTRIIIDFVKELSAAILVDKTNIPNGKNYLTYSIDRE